MSQTCNSSSVMISGNVTQVQGMVFDERHVQLSNTIQNIINRQSVDIWSTIFAYTSSLSYLPFAIIITSILTVFAASASVYSSCCTRRSPRRYICISILEGIVLLCLTVCIAVGTIFMTRIGRTISSSLCDFQSMIHSFKNYIEHVLLEIDDIYS